MPKGELHKKQKTKNWVLFAILLGLVILFFCMGIVRLQQGTTNPIL